MIKEILFLILAIFLANKNNKELILILSIILALKLL